MLSIILNCDIIYLMSNITIKEIDMLGGCPGPDKDLVSVNLETSKGTLGDKRSRAEIVIRIPKCSDRSGTNCRLSNLDLTCPFVDEA